MARNPSGLRAVLNSKLAMAAVGFAAASSLVASCAVMRDEYSYGKGQEYSSAALSWYNQGGAPDHRDACRQQLKMYNRFGAIGTGREDPPEVDADDFMQGCLDGIGSG